MPVERWQSGPVPGIPDLLMPVAHALLQAVDDVAAAAELDAARLWQGPGGVAPVGWHLLHLAGSTDRLFTYARGEPLSDAQRARLAQERELPEPRPDGAVLLGELRRVVHDGLDQLRRTALDTLLLPREVGRARIPSTVLGLLFHAAEHASRHAGQVVTTLKMAGPPVHPLADTTTSSGGSMLIAAIRTVLLRDLAAFQRQVEAYPDESLPWVTPPGITNSTGTLALHCAGNLQHFIGGRLGGTGYLRDRAAEFQRRGVPRAELVAELGRAATAVDHTLTRLDPAVLDTEHPDTFGEGRRVRVGLLLVHLATHLTYHLGQADYHRRVVTGSGAIPGVVGVP